jgi:hypothetical protein
LAPSACTLASRLLPNSPLKTADTNDLALKRDLIEQLHARMRRGGARQTDSRGVSPTCAVLQQNVFKP